MPQSRGPFAKRQKELARREKQQQKQTNRLEAKKRSAESAPVAEGEDPDIAGIKLGPQPREDEDEATANEGGD
jgi:hypothetical protein